MYQNSYYPNKNNNYYPMNNNQYDDRIIGGGFLGPFVLGGITGRYTFYGE